MARNAESTGVKMIKFLILTVGHVLTLISFILKCVGDFIDYAIDFLIETIEQWLEYFEKILKKGE